MSYFFEVKGTPTAEQRVLLSTLISGNRFGLGATHQAVNANLTGLVNSKNKHITFTRRGIPGELIVTVKGGKATVSAQVASAGEDGANVITESKLVVVTHQNDGQPAYRPDAMGLAHVFNEMLAKAGTVHDEELRRLRGMYRFTMLADMLDLGLIKLPGGANWTTSDKPITVDQTAIDKIVNDSLVGVPADKRKAIASAIGELITLRAATAVSTEIDVLEGLYKDIQVNNYALFDRFSGIMNRSRSGQLSSILDILRTDAIYISNESGIYICSELRRWGAPNDANLVVAGPYAAAEIDLFINNLSGFGN